MLHSPPPTVIDSASRATLTAIATIGNARSIPGTKTMILDTQIYVGSANCESLFGSLKFLNASNVVFDNNILYLICATFACNVEDLTDQNYTGYDFFGDLQCLTPLRSEMNNSNYLIDPTQRAYIRVSGGMSDIQMGTTGTFRLNIEQPISAFDDLKDSKSRPIKPITPILCILSARYMDCSKSVPFNCRYISVAGYLTGVVYNQDSKDFIDHFVVSADEIVFMGQQMPPAVPNNLDFSLTPRSGKTPIDCRRATSVAPPMPQPAFIVIDMATPTPTPTFASSSTSHPQRKRRWLSSNIHTSVESNKM